MSSEANYAFHPNAKEQKPQAPSYVRAFLISME
jgi:hypothetical protein